MDQRDTQTHFMEVVMNARWMIRMTAAALVAAASSPFCGAQEQSPQTEVQFSQRNLGGPRLGMTYVTGNALTQKLGDRKIGTVLSQFGWHFEYQVIPEGGGPSFVIQLVPLVAGVEYGTLIPSASLAMGIRFPSGFEFGLGPNMLITDEGGSTALVVAIGKSFNYGGVSIPLNLVWATNQLGNRISIIFGYAIAKAK